MSEAKFPRDKIIKACEEGLASLRAERAKLVTKYTKEIQEQKDEIEKTKWVWLGITWYKPDVGYWNSYSLNMNLFFAEEYGEKTEKRIVRLLAFCEALTTVTVTLSSQEFSDICNCYG